MATDKDSTAANGHAMHRAVLIATLAALSSLAPFSIDMYLPALPALAKYFAVPPSAAEHTITAFFVGFTLGQMFVGTLADRLGRKLPVYLGVGLYVVAALGCALAPSIGMLTGLRVLQALGACAGMVVARAVVRDLFAERDSANVMSHMILAMGLAPLIAPLVGGYVLLFFGWRANFLAMAAIALVILAAAGLQLPETHPPEKRRKLRLGAMLREYWTPRPEPQLHGLFAGRQHLAFLPVRVHHRLAARVHRLFPHRAAALWLAVRLQCDRADHGVAGQCRVPEALAGAHRLEGRASGAAHGAAALLSHAWTGFGGLAAIVISLFFCAPLNGAVVPTSTALAMSPHGDRAGAASALFGTLQFGLAAVSSFVVAAFARPGPLPMAAVIFACAVLALAFNLSTRPRSESTVTDLTMAKTIRARREPEPLERGAGDAGEDRGAAAIELDIGMGLRVQSAPRRCAGQHVVGADGLGFLARQHHVLGANAHAQAARRPARGNRATINAPPGKREHGQAVGIVVRGDVAPITEP